MSSRNSKNIIILQSRDLAVLRGLFDCRVMTLQHVATLYFDGKAEATKKRIQKLKGASLIGERLRRHHEPSILVLTRSGFEALSMQGEPLEYPSTTWVDMKGRLAVSNLTLQHELSVMDVKAAFYPAVNKTDNAKIVEFSTWPALFQFEARPNVGAVNVIVKPDGFIRVHERESNGDLFEHTFYLEVDRSTETQDILISRAACYVDYYRRGGLAVRNGCSPSEYKDFPFRTLIVLQNAERRNNTAERLLLLHPPILSQIWLTTMKEMLADPLGEIWIRPLDYRNATTGTRYEPGLIPTIGGYRRQSEREAHVEASITKHKLLEADDKG